MPDPNMSANPAKARRVIEFIKRPENAGMNNRDVAYALGINESYVRRAKSVFKLGKTMKISPKKLRMDGGTQPRAKIIDAVVDEYVEVWTSGGIFPPPDVFFDGVEYWLADGFHRVLAAIRAGIKKIDVEVHMGNVREAVLFSVGVNATHGVRRTNEDKQRAVLTLLNDEEWSTWPDTKIATRCGVSSAMVGLHRKQSILKSFKDRETVTAERDGKQYPLRTSGLGRKPKTEPKPEPDVAKTEPESSPTEPTEIPPVESNGVHEKNGSEIARNPATPVPAKAPEPAPIPAAQDKAPEPTEAADPDPSIEQAITKAIFSDPPDIAAQRAKGIIPADAKVEVTEPDPADEDEPANVQAEQTDREWLAECPAREKLSPTCRNGFDVAALNYRRTDDERARHRTAMKKILHHPPGFPDYLTSWFNRCCGLKHPKHWVACNDCGGTGQYPALGKCTTCHGRGFHG